ncbi:hypothetical protein [Streptomyces longispororuber]
MIYFLLSAGLIVGTIAARGHDDPHVDTAARLATAAVLLLAMAQWDAW